MAETVYEPDRAAHEPDGRRVPPARLNKVIVYKGPDAFWKFQEDELRKHLPLATKMGIRK